jgi:hypothetical protein
VIAPRPSPRIFISSLMAGYVNIQVAAARAIERAGCEPVRAEDFPAGTVLVRMPASMEWLAATVQS